MAKETSEKVVIESVLIKPRLTEKTALSSEAHGIYAFDVLKEATRKSVADAIKKEHKVTPEKVRLLSVPSKRVFARGKWGVKKGGKKAYVYLKKGDKLNIA
jgi:large subunit ribosomal protein L23